MRGQQQMMILLQLALLLLSCSQQSISIVFSNRVGSTDLKVHVAAYSSSMDPQTFHPVKAPSPMAPFTYNSPPKLSGRCTLNFSVVESILRTSATDCWSPLAPYLANVVCCPQYEASLDILVGQSGRQSGKLALDVNHAKNCLLDFGEILKSQGARENLHMLCSVYPSNLTDSACPVIEVTDIENLIDSSSVLAACANFDPEIECCNQVCKNAISAAAEKMTERYNDVLDSPATRLFSEHLNSSYDCKRVVVRWLAGKLAPSASTKILRGLASCEVNKACPLDFPDIVNVTKECGNRITNQTSCCLAMTSYMSHLQDQSFITNSQSLSCATSLALKLQSANVSSNIYSLCHIKLKDFSIQVNSRESGCLLPSLPLDVTYDDTSGIGFICDLNDNVQAPWSSSSVVSASFCNKSYNSVPEIPKATSCQDGLCVKDPTIYLLSASLMILYSLV